MSRAHGSAGPGGGLRLALILASGLALLGAAPGARADLRTGSRNPLRVHNRLAMPLPSVIRAPLLTRLNGGRVRVTVRMSFVASNWRRSKGVARDRVVVTFEVARRLLTTGPDPAAPVFRKPSVGFLHRRLDSETYSVVLPARIGGFLAARGAFSSKLAKRARALRLVWVDVEQDRDYLHVDGSYDWREGRAANAADALLTRNGALAAAWIEHSVNNNCGTSEPCGTLTIQNQTSNGVYGPSSSYTNGDLPGTPAHTQNQTGVPIAVGASALQCFESGDANSNPTGFANGAGTEQPKQYGPGVVSASMVADNAVTSWGTAVTEPIQANDTIARASNNEMADATGLVQGIMGEAVDVGGWALGLIPNSATGGYGLNVAGLGMFAVSEASLPIPSPGAIVSGALDIAEFVIDNSCDGNANLLAIGVAEPGGAINGAAVEVDKEGIAPYAVQETGSSQTAAGEQMNASQSYYNGSPLYLIQDIYGDGLAGSSNNEPANIDDVIWTDYNPCVVAPTGQIADVGGHPGYSCNVAPVSSPTVSSQVGNVDCGAGNTNCPFAAANFPNGTPTTFGTTAFNGSAVSGSPATQLGSGVGCYQEVTELPLGNALASGQSITSPNGLFTLTMQPNGELVENENAFNGSSPQQLWSSTGPKPSGYSNTQTQSSLTAGSYAAMQTGGSLVILPPTGLTPSFSTNTAVGSGAPASYGNYLAVQNDGNIVVYAQGATALWATHTNVATCSSPGPNG